MDGGVLTIRTDTRWHANAPATMTGTLGNTTVSSTAGGGVLIDSSAVRWMPYNAGSGTVPAIGTTVTRGGASGYLLGVWANYTSAPTAVGAAMPSTGYLKFREVTGGPFTTGALTGIGASATAADRQGWIEIVQDQLAVNTVPRLGFFRTRGGWFELDQVTNGSANQTIQIPTNGGGVGTHVPAVWIETGVGTDVYEMYPAVLGTWFLAANLGTDDRCKFVRTVGSGQVVIGHDGTTAAGFVPPAGCRIRIPSNIGRQCATGTRASNAVPHATLSTRPDFTTSSAGVIDFDFFLNDWYHLFASPLSVKVKNSATFDIHSCSNIASPTELENFCTGSYLATSISLTLTNCAQGGTLSDCKFYRADAASNGHSLSMSGCVGFVFSGEVATGVIQYARSTGLASFGQCRNFTQSGVFTNVAVTPTLSTCVGFVFEKVRYIDRLLGTTNATTGKYAFTTIISSNNVKVNSVDFGGYSGVHPYLGVFNSSNSTNIAVRNGGTHTNPLGGSANAPGSIYVDGGNNADIRVQNIFLTATRTNLCTTVNLSKNQTFERLGGTVGAIQTLSLNTLVKGNRSASNSITGGASVYGSHVFDMFESDILGRIWWALNEPTDATVSDVTLTLTSSKGGFTSGGQVVLPAVGDMLIINMPYYALGHTSFSNTAPTLTGTNTGNLTFEYDIDKNDGGGFTGTYKTLNGANLSAESIDPIDGFKLRLRITCATAANNALTYVRINTVSTATAQQNASYPLDTTRLQVTGLKNPSEVRVFIAGTTTEVAGQEDVTDGVFTGYVDPTGAPLVDISIMALGYLYLRLLNVDLTGGDVSIPVQQNRDRQYNNP
jgi:hypothetical protein